MQVKVIQQNNVAMQLCIDWPLERLDGLTYSLAFNPSHNLQIVLFARCRFENYNMKFLVSNPFNCDIDNINYFYSFDQVDKKLVNSYMIFSGVCLI